MYSEEAKAYTAILIAAGILTLILVFFIIALLVHRKKNEQLHQEKINAEITTLENERIRVAQDLHDEVAMLLSVAKLQLTCIENLESDNQQLLLKASDHIDNSLVKIREIVSDLMPSALFRKGLPAALYEFFNSVNAARKLFIEYSITENMVPISDTASIHLFRIIQEIVQNALKHSGASKLSFVFTSNIERLTISACDNGRGFDEKVALQKNTGLGLRNIVSRVELLNGNIYLDTGKSKGVSYTIDIPKSHTA